MLKSATQEGAYFSIAVPNYKCWELSVLISITHVSFEVVGQPYYVESCRVFL